ncbi:MAG: nucleotidyltransferase family protein [Lachnospiraceae bacterium]|nr:nucleotidyltransferase family protein [Lachnospiraceae bacterium]
MKRSVEEEIIYNSIKWYMFPDKRDQIVFGAYSSEDFLKAVDTAKKHVVVPFLFDAFNEGPLKESAPAECLKEINDITRKTVIQSYRLFFLTRYTSGLLNDNGIKTAVLKGIAAAREYPKMLYRKSGDIDLFLLDKTNLSDAVKILQDNGFLFSEADQTENHQVVLLSSDGIKIELHTMITEPFSETKVNEKLSLFENDLINYTESVSIMGSEILCMQRGAFAFSLLLHALQHFMRAGFGIKLLCDMAVLFENGLSEKEKETYLSLVNENKLTGFSEVILSVCVYYLGLDKEKVPHDLCDIKMCDAFLDDVLAAEEFGRSDVNRMAVMNSTGLGGYFKEFHHQMKLSFPKASKVFIIIPVLWVITLFRFLRNNKKVRNTTAREIFKNSSERSKMAMELEIFKR